MSGRRKPVTWIVDERGCFVCTSHAPNYHGYPMLWARGREHHMHRVLYEEKRSIILPSSVVVRHTCDNRRCINPDHWLPGSHAENSRDMVERQRCNTSRGETRSDAKLSADEVRSIRISSFSQSELAQQYGVNQSTVSRIRADKRRKFG